MKYANRYGDRRSNFYRRDDNIKVGDSFYRIRTLRDVPQMVLDLGNPAAGTIANPTEGNRIEWPELEPRNDDELVHVLIGVQPEGFGVGLTDSASEAPTASVDRGEDYSCWIRYWNPQEQPQWLSPDGSVQAWIDHRISPVGDENEMFPVFVLKDNPPFFRADNPWDHGQIQQYIWATGKLYKLEELGGEPDNYGVVHGVPTKDLITPTEK